MGAGAFGVIADAGAKDAFGVIADVGAKDACEAIADAGAEDRFVPAVHNVEDAILGGMGDADAVT